MLGEFARYVRRTPTEQVAVQAFALWKHGIVVILTLTFVVALTTIVASLAWIVLNALPLLLINEWTFARSVDAFRWTSLIWLPIAYSFGTRYLPPIPYEDDA